MTGIYDKGSSDEPDRADESASVATGNCNFKREGHVNQTPATQDLSRESDFSGPHCEGAGCWLGRAPQDGSRIIGESVDAERVTAFYHSRPSACVARAWFTMLFSFEYAVADPLS